MTYIDVCLLCIIFCRNNTPQDSVMEALNELVVLQTQTLRKLDFLINRSIIAEESILPPPASNEEELNVLLNHENLVSLILFNLYPTRII